MMLKLIVVLIMNTMTPLALKMSASAGESFMGIFNVWLFVAGLSMGVSFVFWRALLVHLKVSFLHPFCALTQITVPLAAWFLFDESLNPLFILGLACVISGIVLTSGASEATNESQL